MLKTALALGFLAGLTMRAPAQPELDGNPDSSRFIRIPKDTDDWTRHFRIGALVGLNLSADFHQNGLFNISGNNAANGIYDDGYVRPDQNGDPNYTSYWGYDNRSLQYNAASQTLQMHSATSYSAANSGSADGGAFPGFELAYGGNLWYWKHARVGWDFGFGLLPVDIKENFNTPAMVTQSTYTFSTATLGSVGFPTASSYQGGSSGIGPVLSTAYTNSSSVTSGTVSGSQELDVMLYTFRLGPSFYWDLTKHVGMSLGAGPAFGIVSGNYKYNESIAVGSVNSHNSGKIGGTDFVYGGYVNGTVMYHVQANGNADIFVSAQYMPMSDATIGNGSGEGRLKLGGQLYISAGINWPF
ncbi:MAG TPA: hypothetical protein VFY06_05335 [Verrucomicrobiae bacterium]|nr:hypothetical protein [Verrucomicrobiae bacterium]